MRWVGSEEEKVRGWDRDPRRVTVDLGLPPVAFLALCLSSTSRLLPLPILPHRFLTVGLGRPLALRILALSP
jgi:hypothetical protein